MIRRVLVVSLLLTLLTVFVAQPAAAQSVVWRGEYYNNPTLEGSPAFTRSDSSLAFNWGVGSPGSGVGNDNFSVRWATDVALSAGTYRFTVLADDNVRVIFNFNPVPLIDTFANGQVNQTVTADLNVPAGGTYHIQVDYREVSDAAFIYLAFANLATSPGGPQLPVSVPINLASWTAQYYGNTSFVGDPAAIVTVPSPSANWGAGSPLPAVPIDNWAARFTSVQPLPGGNYTINVRADDGVRVSVNGNTVINRLSAATGQTDTATVTLPAGNATFQVEFVELGGDASLDYQLVQTTTITPTQVPNNPAPTGATATVTAFRLNVRATPDPVSGAVLTRINRFESYPVVGRNTDATWYQINVNGTVGWVSARFVTISGGANVPPASGGIVAQPPTAAAPTGLTATASPYTVNIRTGAGTQFDRIARLPAGQSAPIVGRTANNTWYQINFNGIVGWVSAQFVVLPSGANLNNVPVTG